MPFKHISIILLLVFNQRAFSESVYRCTDPATKIVTYTDRTCTNTATGKIDISEINTAVGISAKEKHSLQQLNKRLSNNKTKPRRTFSLKKEKAAQQKRCAANQLRIDKINSRLRQGYKGNKYDYYHDKLRPLKNYRSRHCI